MKFMTFVALWRLSLMTYLSVSLIGFVAVPQKPDILLLILVYLLELHVTGSVFLLNQWVFFLSFVKLLFRTDLNVN